MAAESLLEPKALELLRMLDRDRPGSFSEFVRMFVHEAPDLVRKMEQAHVARDPDALGKAAHYLRSAALAMGASDLVGVCQGQLRRGGLHMAHGGRHIAAQAGQLDEAALQAATDTAHMLAPPTP